MAGSGPDPGEFLERAQRVLRELFGETRDDDPWGQETRRRGPSSEQRRENLAFALATRAVEALEDLALNVAAIRQRLERTQAQAPDARPRGEESGSGGADAGK